MARFPTRDFPNRLEKCHKHVEIHLRASGRGFKEFGWTISSAYQNRSHLQNLGYSPGFLLKIYRFRTLGNSDENAWAVSLKSCLTERMVLRLVWFRAVWHHLLLSGRLARRTEFLTLVPPPSPPQPRVNASHGQRLGLWLVTFARARTVMVKEH